jgi:hypothetical protein
VAESTVWDSAKAVVRFEDWRKKLSEFLDEPGDLSFCKFIATPIIYNICDEFIATPIVPELCDERLAQEGREAKRKIELVTIHFSMRFDRAWVHFSKDKIIGGEFCPQKHSVDLFLRS